MDKKNTMLLTVIAVATLLVAVVGATFAFFSVTGSSNTTNTGAQVTVTKFSQVSLGGGTAGLVLNLDASHMAESADAQGRDYAVKSGAPVKGTVQNHNVATATLGLEEGDNNTYYCAWTVTVSATDNGLVSALAAETTNVTDAAVVISGAGLNETINLKELSAAKTYTAEVTLNSAKTTDSITADVYVENENFSQGSLAGTGVTVSVANTGFVCDTAAMPTPAA